MSATPPELPQFAPQQRTFSPHSASVGMARTFVLKTLTEWGVEGRSEDVQYCVSELATNALIHGSSAAGFSVQLNIGDDLIRIEVGDLSAEVPQTATPDCESDGGRGLLLVASFADMWGVEPDPRGGKTVWTEFKVAGLQRVPSGAAL
ncbi:ATP-binding protein [Streptomyces sp. NPDC059002]|uniref:ATP-binding protein n=1 Tax=Streptomyces sp. NPDC059002 TaxID=3346690 RepID=UPI0036A07B5C